MVAMNLTYTSDKEIKILSATLSLLLIACSAPDVGEPKPNDPKIDSSISLSQIASIKEEITVGDFLKVLGLSEEGEDRDDLLETIRFLNSQMSVNQYVLEGGGGVEFTTRVNLTDRKMEDVVYSEKILGDVVTSFNYSCDGRNYSFSLVDGHYIERR